MERAIVGFCALSARCRWWAILWVLLLGGAVPVAHARPIVLRVLFRVVDEAGKPIKGAIIINREADKGLGRYGPAGDRGKAVTNERGIGVMQCKSGIAINIKIFKEGYTVATLLRFTAPQERLKKPMAVTLRRLCVLSGRLIERRDKESVPIHNMHVEALLNDAHPLTDNMYMLSPSREVLSDKNGRFVLQDLPPGPISFIAYNTAHRDRYFRVEDLKPGENRSLNEIIVERIPTGDLTGTVEMDRKGIEPNQFDLSVGRLVTGSGGRFIRVQWRSIPIDKDWTFHAKGLEEGDYIYFFTWLSRDKKRGIFQAQEKFRIQAGKAETVQIRGHKNGTLHGVVTGLDGKPSFGVQVTANHLLFERSTFKPLSMKVDVSVSVFTDKNGRYRFEDLMPGAYLIRMHDADLVLGKYADLPEAGNVGPVTLQQVETKKVRVEMSGQNIVFSSPMSTLLMPATKGALGYDVNAEIAWLTRLSQTGRGVVENVPATDVVLGVKYYSSPICRLYTLRRLNADTLKGKEPVPVKFEIKKGVTLHGKVVLRKGGKIVPSRILLVDFLSAGAIAEAGTQADGTFTIQHIQPGTYAISVVDLTDSHAGPIRGVLQKQTVKVVGDEDRIDLVIDAEMKPSSFSVDLPEKP